jgi:hypothetical protein
MRKVITAVILAAMLSLGCGKGNGSGQGNGNTPSFDDCGRGCSGQGDGVLTEKCRMFCFVGTFIGKVLSLGGNR